MEHLDSRRTHTLRMPVHPAVTLTGTHLAGAAYRSPEEQHDLMRNHVVAWLREEMRAPCFLALGRPGYTVHRQFVSSSAGDITADSRTKVEFVREFAQQENLSTISFAGQFHDHAKRRRKNEIWTALYLLITCSQDRVKPLLSGWQLRGKKAHHPETVRSLRKPETYVDVDGWCDVFAFDRMVSWDKSFNRDPESQ